MQIIFSEANRDPICMKYIENYGRLNGWYLANKLNLPTQKECFVITNTKDIEKCYRSVCENEILYCRADAPWGKGNNLLRSKDLIPAELESFYKICKENYRDTILLVFIHPSVWIANEYIPRYKTSGAAQVLFQKDEKVIVELVGEGFDCGDLSRGKTLHYKLETDKEMMLYGISDTLKASRSIKNIYEISQDNYRISREHRIEEILKCYGKSCETNIKKSIPEKVMNFNRLLKIVYQNCIYPVLDSSLLWNDFVVMMNLYNNQPYIYEVWQPKRSSIQ